MKQLLMAMVVALLPTAAFGFTDNARAASADSLNGAASRVNTATIGDDIQCTSAGCGIVIHRTFPREATSGAVQVYLARYSPDATLAGNVCEMVCIGVVKDGEPPANVSFGACTALMNTDFTAAPGTDRLHITNMLTVVPNDTTNTPCAGNACAGADEFIQILRFPSGSCSGTPSTNLVNYRFVTLQYQ